MVDLSGVRKNLKREASMFHSAISKQHFDLKLNKAFNAYADVMDVSVAAMRKMRTNKKRRKK